MKTLIIDIINENAVRLIQDLETLKLIRVHKEKRKKKLLALLKGIKKLCENKI